MPDYRKKPVVIQAQRFTGGLLGDIISSGIAAGKIEAKEDALGPCLLIETLEGDMRANPGDWIIRGVQGEFYPCKDEIFRKTYEAVE